ncbi:MAG: hypothetical protein ACM37W_17430 [Actinomycetota bacterium]
MYLPQQQIQQVGNLEFKRKCLLFGAIAFFSGGLALGAIARNPNSNLRHFVASTPAPTPAPAPKLTPTPTLAPVPIPGLKPTPKTTPKTRAEDDGKSSDWVSSDIVWDKYGGWLPGFAIALLTLGFISFRKQ